MNSLLNLASLRMHESTQRLVRRAGLMLLGFAPLLVCVLFSLLEFSSGYQNWRVSWWEELLSRRLGVAVQLDQVLNHTPGTTELRGITLRHPESAELLGTADSVSVTRSEGKAWVHLHRGELEQEQLGNVWRIIHELYVCRPNNHGGQARLTADEIILRRSSTTGMQSGKIRESLRDITIDTYPQPSKLLIQSEFRYGDSPDSPLSNLLVQRDRSTTEATTRLKLLSGTPLPCSLLHGLIEGSESLGAYAQFVGTIDANIRLHRWEATLSNVALSNINCATALSRSGLNAEQLISGYASLYLKEATLVKSQLLRAEGEVVFLNGGKLSTHTIAMMPHLDIYTRGLGNVLSVPFSNGKLRFRISAGELSLQGGLPYGVLFSEGGQPIAWRREPANVPLSRLPQLLPTSVDGQQSAGALWLSNWLPVVTSTSHVASLPQHQQ